MSDAQQALPPARHEPKDVGLRFMLALFAGIAATVLALLAIAYAIYPSEVGDHRFEQPFPSYPLPRLQPSPRADMEAFYAAETRQLNTAGWQDRARGAVHIPIDQAMRAIANEGIPGWPTGRTDVSGGDRR